MCFHFLILSRYHHAAFNPWSIFSGKTRVFSSLSLARSLEQRVSRTDWVFGIYALMHRMRAGEQAAEREGRNISSKRQKEFELLKLLSAFGFCHVQCVQLMLFLKLFATKNGEKVPKLQLHSQLLLAHCRPALFLLSTRSHNINVKQ